MIQYPCTRCGASIVTAPEKAGSWESCPSCGTATLVPNDSQASPPPDQAPGQPPPYGQPGQPPPYGQPGQPLPYGQPAQQFGGDQMEEQAEKKSLRKKGWSNILWGGLLIAMGLSGLFGGSIFKGNASGFDIFFDVLGLGMIIYGIIQLVRS